MIRDQKFAKELAADLLKINAVVLRPENPFIWSSGWKSPIYCDNRLTLRYPAIRKKIAKAFKEIIDDKFGAVDVITGTATAGIPHAAWVAEAMDKPMAYVRSKAKSHGMTNQIEGGIAKGQNTVIIEDLISTGGSVLSVAEVIKVIDADVSGICAIFTYGFEKASKEFENHNLKVYTLTDYPTLIDVAIEQGYVEGSELSVLNEWREKPDTWPNVTS
jgi:orotate phosphoribosyltransferase